MDCIFNMMMNCSNVGEALERLVKYHDIVADAIRPNMDINSAGVCIFWEYFGPALKMPDQLGEALLALYTKMLRRLTDAQLVLLEIRFTSSAPDNLDLYNKIFKAPLKFGKAENELLLDIKCLDQPIFLADPTVLTALEQLADRRMQELFSEKTLSMEVGRLINKTLLDVPVTRVRNGVVAFNMQQFGAPYWNPQLNRQRMANSGFGEIFSRKLDDARYVGLFENIRNRNKLGCQCESLAQFFNADHSAGITFFVSTNDYIANDNRIRLFARVGQNQLIARCR